LVHGPDLNLYFDPAEGGTLFELDFKPLAVNLLDTLARREEGYHHRLRQMNGSNRPAEGVASIHDRVTVKEEGLDKLLWYDRYRRVSFRDHFLAEQTTPETLAQCRHQEMGDFIDGIYQCRTRDRKGQRALEMFREGHLRANGKKVSLLVSKTLSLPKKGAKLEVLYRLENRSEGAVTCWFGVELNFALLAGDAPDRYYWIAGADLKDPRLASSGQTEKVSSFGLRDEYLGLEIALAVDKPAALWRFPIETVSQSEGGFERVYQSSVVFPNWKLDLEVGGVWEMLLVQEVSKL
jgi:alpha-amylase